MDEYSLDATITLDTQEDYNNLNKFFTENKIENKSVEFNKVKEYFMNNKIIESKLCIGNTPDKKIEYLNNQCKKYEGFIIVNDIYKVINNL